MYIYVYVHIYTSLFGVHSVTKGSFQGVLIVVGYVSHRGCTVSTQHVFFIFLVFLSGIPNMVPPSLCGISLV